MDFSVNVVKTNGKLIGKKVKAKSGPILHTDHENKYISDPKVKKKKKETLQVLGKKK